MDDEFSAVTEVAEAPVVKSETSTQASGVSVEAPDAATQLEELQQKLSEVEKERNDLKSQTVGRQRAVDRDSAIHDRLEGLNDRMEGLSRSVTAMMTHMASDEGDPEALQGQLKSIENQSVANEASRKWGQTYNRAVSMLQEAINDGDERVLDTDGPELADAKKVWNAASDDKDVEGLFRAVHLANQARLKADRMRNAEAAKPDPKDALEMGTSAPGGSSPRTLGAADLWRAYGRGEIPFNDDVKRAGRELGRI
jgi:predicted nuclease with TOPRIM domain